MQKMSEVIVHLLVVCKSKKLQLHLFFLGKEKKNSLHYQIFFS